MFPVKQPESVDALAAAIERDDFSGIALSGAALAWFLEGADEPCHHGIIQQTTVEHRAGTRWYVTRCEHCGATLDIHDEAQERERVLETLLRPPARPEVWLVSAKTLQQLQNLRRFDVTYVESKATTGCTIGPADFLPIA